jgi:hypothetical protein
MENLGVALRRWQCTVPSSSIASFGVQEWRRMTPGLGADLSAFLFTRPGLHKVSFCIVFLVDPRTTRGHTNPWLTDRMKVLWLMNRMS